MASVTGAVVEAIESPYVNATYGTKTTDLQSRPTDS